MLLLIGNTVRLLCMYGCVLFCVHIHDKVWNDGVPSLGWHDTLCYLSIPVILVITQSISQQLMQPPKKPGAEADTSQVIT
jgi:TRAP-type C4-dicarboxylate transport system permease small subunit